MRSDRNAYIEYIIAIDGIIADQEAQGRHVETRVVSRGTEILVWENFSTRGRDCDESHIIARVLVRRWSGKTRRQDEAQR